MDVLLNLIFDALRSLTVTLAVHAWHAFKRPRPFAPKSDSIAWLLAALVSFAAAGAIFFLLLLTSD